MSDTVHVRAATRADAGAIQAIYARVVLDTATSFEETPPDVEEIMRRMVVPPRMPWLVATRDEAVMGYAYAAIHRARRAYRWSADCSVYLHEQERGRGTGRRLYRQLFVELRGIGYICVFAGIALPNDASVGLHEVMGFKPIGTFQQVGFKHGKWHDVGWWQLRLTQPPRTPAEPRPWQPQG